MRNPKWVVVAVAAVAVSLLSGCVATTSDVATTPPTASTTSLDPAVRAQLEAALDEGFAASGMPGVIVALWIPGEDEWIATRGVSDLASNLPMERANQSKIGSITKTIVGTVHGVIRGEIRDTSGGDPFVLAWDPQSDDHTGHSRFGEALVEGGLQLRTQFGIEGSGRDGRRGRGGRGDRRRR